MKINVLIFGASGMVGKGVLLECLESDEISSVLSIGRSTCNITHTKLTEIIHQDMFNLSTLKEKLTEIDACYYCLGVSSMGMDEAKYANLTYDLTLHAAKILVDLNNKPVFIYVSGTGTDSSEKGRIMWARIKGKTENALIEMPFKAAYMFRPGYIQPLKGVKTKVVLGRIFYNIVGWLYPLLKFLFPKQILTTSQIGQAMITLSKSNEKSGIYECADINQVSE